jgi:hypothetical protein
LDASTEAYMHYILALYGKGQKEKIKNLLLNSEYKKRDFEGERKYLLAAALYLSEIKRSKPISNASIRRQFPTSALTIGRTLPI